MHLGPIKAPQPHSPTATDLATVTEQGCTCAGNEWTLEQLGTVMLCGMAASVAPVFLKLLIHDRYTLGSESDAYATAAPPRGAAAGGPAAAPRGMHGGCKGGGSVGARMAACMPEDILDLKDNPAPYCQHSRGSGQSRGTLPVIFSGAELRLDSSDHPDHESGANCAAANGNAKSVVGLQDDAEAAHDAPTADSGHPAAAGEAAAAGGSDKVEGWLQEAHGAPGVTLAASPFEAGHEVEGGAGTGGVTEPLLGAGVWGAGGGATGVPAGAEAGGPWAWWPQSMVLGAGWVPYVVFSADLISGLASGMTIKFFPIFFMEKVRRRQCMHACASVLRRLAAWSGLPSRKTYRNSLSCSKGSGPATQHCMHLSARSDS